MRLILDLELSPQTGRLLSAGWLREDAGEALSGNAQSGSVGADGLDTVLALLRELQAQGGTLVGHNIRAFDLPHLWQLSRQQPQAEVSAQAHASWPELYGGAVLDTLELSTLLWPGRPKHALEKLYRQQAAASDPVADAHETLERLHEAQQFLREQPPRPALLYWWSRLLAPGALRDMLLAGAAVPGVMQAAADLVGPESSLAADSAQRLWAYLEGLAPQAKDNFGALVALGWLLGRHRASHRRPAWAEQQWPTFGAAEAAALGEADLSQEALERELHAIYGPDWHFREGQLELIQNLLGAQKLPLGLLPTGGGKSLTFQFPALWLSRRTRGLTVVMSPLVALMEDQVLSMQEQLPEYAERVAYLSGTQAPDVQREVLAGLWEGRIDLVYLSPERLRNSGVQRLLRHRRPALWVLDEAHTLSQWGIDFRPDFLRIAPLIAHIHAGGPSPLLGLVTATATARVLADLEEYLLMPLGKVLGERPLLRLPSVQPSPWRSAIQTQIIQMPRDERLGAARAELLTHAGQGRVSIVYVRSRKLAQEYALSLGAGGGLRAAAFHAGLAATDKRDILRQFKEGLLDVVVATSAFGMGIDRAGIHTVIHMSPPNTAESYLQEIGRVARKPGETGRALMYWDTPDFATSLRQDALARIGRDGLKKCWHEARKCLQRPAEQRWLSSSSFEKPLALDPGPELVTQTRVALRALESYGLLLEGEQQKAELHLRLHAFQPPALQPVLGTAGQRLADWVTRSQGWQEGMQLHLDIMETALLAGLRPADILQGARQLVSAGLAEWSYRVTVRFRPRRQNRLDRVRRSVQDLLAQWQDEQVTAAELELVDAEAVHADLQLRHKENTFEWARLGLKILGLAQSRKEGVRWSMTPLPDAPPLGEWQAFAAQQFAQLARVWEMLSSKRTDGQDTLTLDMAELELPVLALGAAIGVTDRHSTGPAEYLLALEQLGLIDVARGDEAAANIFRLSWGNQGERARYNAAAFTPLAAHYDDRTRRIHVMRLLIEQPDEAARQRFIEDYFALPLPEFCQRYAPNPEELTVAQLPGTRERILAGLSETQRRIVSDSESRALLVLAGPGSGKTRVVVHRAAALLALENVAPEQILILAYNRTAVAEVRERLGALLSPLGLSYRPKVLTFHGLARELTGQRATDAPSTQGLQDPDAQNRWLLGQLIEYLQENEVAYRYILVDEYQDIDDQKYQIIRELTNFRAPEAADKGATDDDQAEQQSYLVAVGDDDQNIYGFQGADIRYIQQFRADYQIDAESEFCLTDNYRSSPELVALSNAFIAASLGQAQRLKGPEQAIVSRVAQPGKVGFCHYAATPQGRYAAAYTIARKMLALHAQGEALHDMAVLAPTWQDLRAVEHALREAGLAAQPLNTAEHLRPAGSLLGRHLLELLELAPSTLCTDPCAALPQLCAPYSLQDRSYSALLASLHGLKDTTYEVMATRLRAARPLARGAVALSTFHSAKGSEFEQVFVLDTGKDARSHNPRIRQDATRALYVALTRARRGLFVLSERGGGHPTFTPQWIKEHFQLSQIPEATPPRQYPQTLRYSAELAPADLYLSHPQVISAVGRASVDAYARAWGPLQREGDKIKSAGKVVAALSRKQRVHLDQLAQRQIKVARIEAVQIFYCERVEEWYKSYQGKEMGHFVVLPRFELEVPFGE